MQNCPSNIPTYKHLLNNQSSCKKLYIIKQNYMHIKHPIYSFQLYAQGSSSPNLSLETHRAVSTGPAGLTAQDLTTVSTDARLKSFLLSYTFLKSIFVERPVGTQKAGCFLKNPISLSIN